MKKKKKNKILTLKPVSKDIYYEYICSQCGCNHWITHREASSKNFRIICDCEAIIKPQRIIDTKIIYAKPKHRKNDSSVTTGQRRLNPSTDPVIKETNGQENNTACAVAETSLLKIQQQAANIMSQYGYTIEEAMRIIINCDEKNEVKTLVKEALTKIGKEHEYFYNKTYEV